MKLGRRLKELLDERHETQRDLAKRFGWGDTTVSQYVRGLRQPDLETVERLAAYFGVTVDYLFGRTDDPKATVDPVLPDDWEETIRNLKSQGITPEDIESAIELIKAYKKMREG